MKCATVSLAITLAMGFSSLMFAQQPGAAGRRRPRRAGVAGIRSAFGQDGDLQITRT